MSKYGRGFVKSMGWSEDGSAFQAVIEYQREADLPDWSWRMIWESAPVQIVPIPADAAAKLRQEPEEVVGAAGFEPATTIPPGDGAPKYASKINE